jgi:polyferredoxin
MSEACECAAAEKPLVQQIVIQQGAHTTRWSERIEALFVRHRDKLIWLHAAMFVLFLAVIAVPPFLPDPPETATPWTHYTTLANYLLWGVWFPLVFLSVIFTGRSWCGILCPMGAATEWTNKVGLQWRIPRWMRWEGTPAVSFILVTLLGQTLGVRDHADGAAILFGGTMAMAIVVGFLYGRKKRAWCRHLCPIGRVLGLYSRLGPVNFEPQVKIPGRDIYSLKGACPTMIDLPHKAESRHCIECFRCVNPGAKGSVRMVFRRLGSEIEQIRGHRANFAEAWMLFLDTGIALGGFLWLILPQYQRMRQAVAEVAIERDWSWLLESGPSWLMSVHPERAEVFWWLDFAMIVGFMSGFMLVMAVVLGGLTAAAARLSGVMGGDGNLRQRFTELGYQYAPVAMVSLIVGLGGMLFEPIKATPLGAEGAQGAKVLLFLVGAVWSVWLGERILARQGVPAAKRWLPLLPGVLGSVIVGAAWWPAIFGL